MAEQDKSAEELNAERAQLKRDAESAVYEMLRSVAVRHAHREASASEARDIAEAYAAVAGVRPAPSAGKRSGWSA